MFSSWPAFDNASRTTSDGALESGDEVRAQVLSGEAEIVFTLGGKSEVVGTSRRGELLGEMSLLLNDQKGASAGVRSSQGMDLL